MRNQGLRGSLGKNALAARERGLRERPCGAAEVRGTGAGVGARLPGLVPSFAIQSHAVPS